MQPSIGYTSVLIIVIIELTFAFGVGVGCILFSFNLLRSVYSAEENTYATASGAFPRAKSTTVMDNSESRSTLDEPLFEYNTFDDSQQVTSMSETSLMSPSGSIDRGYNQERNHPQTVFGIVKTFTDYMRIY